MTIKNADSAYSIDVVADTGCFPLTTPKLKEAEFLIAYSSIDGHESYGNE